MLQRAAPMRQVVDLRCFLVSCLAKDCLAPFELSDRSTAAMELLQNFGLLMLLVPLRTELLAQYDGFINFTIYLVLDRGAPPDQFRVERVHK